MPWPQDPPPAEESILVDSGCGYTGWLATEDPFLGAGIAVVTAITVILLLARDPDASWRSRRVAAAARKGAARFARPLHRGP